MTLLADVQDGLPPVRADADRLAQVLRNLLVNALRHTPEGGRIILSAEQRDDNILLKVMDTGSGIPAEDLPYIFNRFYRGDQARRQTGESGLGLAIARSIIEAHGGTITVDSTAGVGSTFTIMLPEQV